MIWENLSQYMFLCPYFDTRIHKELLKCAVHENLNQT